ncbi:MAG: RNA polymerase subunit sigma-70 [Motilibacteraceae bacterium]
MAEAGGELVEAAEALRHELVVHCYRLLGSVPDSEDAVQETMLRAWRASDRYDESRASIRTWLYKIATNVCLTALETRSRRPLPTGLGGPSNDPDAPLRPDLEVPWLQPLPDIYLGGGDPRDPAERAGERQSVRLALVAALQLLPPRQRAVLVLRDVLAFSAAEVADQLSTSTASVNSALQRARATLAAAAPREDELADPADPAVRASLERYVRAFEAADVPALVGLLTADVVLEMPPVPLWYRGAEDYGRFITRVFAVRGTGWRMLPVGANGQPSLAAYAPSDDGVLGLHTLQVLTIGRGGISHNVVFQDPQVFASFGLQPRLDPAG